MRHRHGGKTKRCYQTPKIYRKRFKLSCKKGPQDVEETEEPRSPINGELQNSEVQSKSRSPWRTGIHETPEKVQNSQPEELQLRRSTRERRPNPKYIDAAYAEVKEPATFEEASKSP